MIYVGIGRGGEGYRQMSNSEFHQFCAIEEEKKLDLYPEPIRAKIEELILFEQSVSDIPGDLDGRNKCTTLDSISLVLAEEQKNRIYTWNLSEPRFN